MESPKRIDKLHYRGSRTHHEAGGKHAHKASLPYRRKGTKIERRSRRSQLRRKVS